MSRWRAESVRYYQYILHLWNKENQYSLWSHKCIEPIKIRNLIPIMHICVFSVKSRHFSRLFQTCSEIILQKLPIEMYKYYGGHFSICILRKYKENSAQFFPLLYVVFHYANDMFPLGALTWCLESEAAEKAACRQRCKCYTVSAQHRAVP
jgi:hypothetical protein